LFPPISLLAQFAPAQSDRVADLPAHEAMGLRSYVGIPLHHEGDFYGTLVCCDTDPREFTDQEIEHARTAARLLGAFL